MTQDARPRIGHHLPKEVPRAIVMASSAGGLAALSTILAHMPRHFPAPILVVQHRGREYPHLLGEILTRRTTLDVRHAEEGDELRAGTVYIALPDSHLVVRPDRRLGYTDHRRIKYLRSAANPLFESASEIFGKGLVAVVLTGADADATDGVQSVKKHGGIVIAQDKATSEVFDMPRAAIATGCVDQVLPLERIAGVLKTLVGDDHPPPSKIQ
jgi:two-component system chemotaxis response regulator CheB